MVFDCEWSYILPVVVSTLFRGLVVHERGAKWGEEHLKRNYILKLDLLGPVIKYSLFYLTYASHHLPKPSQ